MKKLIVVFLMLAGFNFVAQTSCQTAQPFCAGGSSGLTFPATTGVTSAQPGPNYGCLSTTPNPAWYYLQISQSGNLDILIQGMQGQNPGQDVDFIAWGPFTSLANVCNNLTAANTIDCSYSASFTETLNIVGAVAGQYYMVLITNFANTQQNIVFNQYAGNGSTNCALVANNSAICAGSSATITANNTTNLTNPTYSINPGGITSPTPTFVVSPSATTQFTIFVTGTNNQSQVQTVTATANVTVNPSPNVSPTFTQASCTSTFNAVNLGLSFSPSSPVPTYTVTWNPQPASVTSFSQSSATQVNAGTTNVTITTSSGCSVTTSFTMAPIPGPVNFTISPAGPSYSITCLTPSVNLTASPTNYTYSWLSVSNPSLSGSSITIGAGNQGNYTVTATDPVTGCNSAPQTFTVGQDVTLPTSTVTPNSQIVTCNSGAVTFTATALSPTINIEHQWYCPQTPFPAGPPNFVSNGIVSPFSTNCGPGTYTHVLVNLTNGCTVTKTVNITSVAGFPTFQTSSTTNYSVGCTPLNQTTLCMINATSVNSAAVQYLFLPPGTASAVPVPTTAFGAQSCTVTTLPGTWTLVVQDPVNGCQTALQIPILQNTIAPHVNATYAPLSQTLTCFNPTILATGSSTTAGATISWSVPSTPPVIPSNTIILGPATGPATHSTNLTYANYYVIATNTVNACKTTSLVVVNQNFRVPTPSLAVGNPSVINCTGICPILSYTNNAANSGAQGAVGQVMSWCGPAPSPCGPSTLPQYTACVAGVYTITVRDSYNGCTGSKTFTIQDRTQPPIIADPARTATLDCGNGTGSSSQSVTLNAILTQSISSWLLILKDYPSGVSLSPLSIVSPGLPSGPSPTSTPFSVDKTGSYTYVVVNQETGCRATGVINVVSGGLNADFTSDVETGFAPLNVSFTNNSSTGITSNSITSIWNFGNGSVQTTTTNISTFATYTSPGTYTVLLTATKGACIDSISKVIKVEVPSKLEIPNVFTPNDDNSNDVWFLKTSSLAEITALVYDRWGNKVYEVTSTTGNIAWDGKNMDGKICSDGTYFYIIKAMGRDGKNYEQKGTVSIYR